MFETGSASRSLGHAKETTSGQATKKNGRGIPTIPQHQERSDNNQGRLDQVATVDKDNVIDMEMNDHYLDLIKAKMREEEEVNTPDFSKPPDTQCPILEDSDCVEETPGIWPDQVADMNC